MRTSRGMIFAFATLALFSELAFCSPTRRALVIGNDTYPGNALKNARNDAKSVADALTSLGYTSTLALDVDRRGMTAAIDGFSASLVTGDTAVVYYAGHGLQVAGENYLVPVDFRVSDETDAKYQGYALSTLLGKITEHGATTQIVILDACRDNPFLGARSMSGGWASVATSAGSFLAFGTSPGSTASDDPSEGHGLFTKSLLSFLSSKMDVEQMFQQVRQDVIQKSNGHQVPWTASSLIGSFHIDPRADATAPVLQSMMPTFERTSPSSQARSITPIPQPQKIARRVAPNDPMEAQMLTDAVGQVRGLHFEKALTILHAVLSFDPRCAIALRILGTIYHLLGRSVEAHQALDMAIEVNPNDAAAYSYRCLVKTAEGSESESDCKEAILIRDDLPQSHLGLALSLVSTGQDAMAYDEATKGISLDPNSAVGYAVRGEIAASQNQIALAQQDYQRAATIAGENAK